MASQVSAQDILTLAKQGHPKVIAAILNHSTRQLNIKTQVARQDQCLYVFLEGPELPNQEKMVSFVRNGIQKLNVETITTIRVYGRQIGNNSVAWNQDVHVNARLTPILSSGSKVTQASQLPPGTDTPPEFTAIPSTSEDRASTATETALQEASRDTAIQSAQTLYRRPEALALIIFVAALMLWQLYLALVEEVAPEGFLSTKELAQRLGVTPTTVRRRKRLDDFGEWSRNLDPEGVAWAYSDGAYVPVI